MFEKIKKQWVQSGFDSSIEGLLREAAKGNALEVQRWYFKFRQDVQKKAMQDGVTVDYMLGRVLSNAPNEKALLYRETVKRLSAPGGILDEVNQWIGQRDSTKSIATAFSQGASENTATSHERTLNKSDEYSSWEEWLHAFKREAGKFNSQLTPDYEGKCLIDFMDHEPLKRAYQDHIDPVTVARGFAAQFDIKTFGFRPQS